MNFSNETIVGLKRLCKATLVNEHHFREIVDNCVRAVQNDEPIHKSKSDDVELHVIKSAYASLTILFTESARHGMDSNMLKNILEDYNLSSDRISFIVEIYGKHRQNIKLKLLRIGTNFPHIIDVHWRMDYNIKSDCNKQYLKPFFHIQLVTLTCDGKKKMIRFVCSVQNLEELVFLLKSSVRHMNKLVSSTL